MPTSAFSCSVLMCHAPIVVPEVGEPRAGLCASSTQSMRNAASLIAASDAEVVLLLSPHTPRYRMAFGVVEGPEVWGDFSAFGRPDIGARFASNRGLQAEIVAAAHRRGIDARPVPSGPLDHGALVPLHFLRQAGYKGEVVVLGFPYTTDATKNSALGHALEEAVSVCGKRVALLASGDMSHRLIPGAPAGFHPQATRFDRLVIKCVESGEYQQIAHIDADLRECAGEDVVDSLEIAAAALRGQSEGRRVLSYEAPFGVGYLVAILANHGSHVRLPPSECNDSARR